MLRANSQFSQKLVQTMDKYVGIETLDGVTTVLFLTVTECHSLSAEFHSSW